MSSFGLHHTSLQFLHCCCSSSPKFILRNPNFSPFNKASFFANVSERVRVLKSSYGCRNGNYTVYCFRKLNTENEEETVDDESERPPFDINLAVVLAGFAFEAYSTPPENIGRHEVNAVDCKTVFLSESFLREIYDGQLFVKLKKGVDLPIMDPWGTSDPYVVMQLDGQVVKSKTKWATKEPTWNEDFTLNIKKSPTRNLQVAAWDANLVTPHKRMGNAGLSLESLCDGNLHEVLVDLEGMGGGGKIYLEIKYKSFDEIDEEKQWWRIPLISDFLRKNSLDSALKVVLGSETVQARQFVRYAFGQLRSLNDAYFQNDLSSKTSNYDMEGPKKDNNIVSATELPLQQESNPKRYLDDSSSKEDENLVEFDTVNGTRSNGRSILLESDDDKSMQSDSYFWRKFTEVINQTVVQKVGFPMPEIIKWDGFDLLNKIGLQSQRIAEAEYVESGLATPESQDVDYATAGSTNEIETSLPDIRKASWDVLRQTDSILGALMVLSATFSKKSKEAQSVEKNGTENDFYATTEFIAPLYSTNVKAPSTLDQPMLDEKRAEEMKALFSTAESAMEAWAMLATSLGQPSFIKSEFEKICFLDNTSTDTQVAIWRDSLRKRLVVAFRGTEQTRWKDLCTDLMLLPAGLNPERIGGDFKQEIQVHSGFLSAYDSVRTRIMSLMKLSIGFVDDGVEAVPQWHVYVTGHSLGGALATLLALELSSSQLAKQGAISVTMYNFGSPRVGNKRFADAYNKKVKDSWRVVNHRDIIPTVPRLMGYCHVAQPVYLAAGDLRDALENMEIMGDGYEADVIGESTPDVLVSEFMKGEKELVEKILNTEINIFRSIRDGSALMQHMEDFYYVTLLENVRLNYQIVGSSKSNEEDSLSIS